MPLLVQNWLKSAALEVQEYVHLVTRSLRGLTSPPIYRYDIVEQLDVIGVGSLRRRSRSRSWRCSAQSTI